MHGHRREVVVVQAGPAQLGFGQLEAERLDQMQLAARRRDHADRIAGVGRDARREEHHFEHNALSSLRALACENESTPGQKGRGRFDRYDCQDLLAAFWRDSCTLAFARAASASASLRAASS